MKTDLHLQVEDEVVKALLLYAVVESNCKYSLEKYGK